jgi:hypothetical protein
VPSGPISLLRCRFSRFVPCGFVALWLCRFGVGGACQFSAKTRDSMTTERLSTVRVYNHNSSVHMSSILDEQARLLPSVPLVEDIRGLRLDLTSPANLDSFSAQPCTYRRHEGLCLPVGRLSSRTRCSSCCNLYRIETCRRADAATRGATAGRGPTPLRAKDRQR